MSKTISKTFDSIRDFQIVARSLWEDTANSMANFAKDKYADDTSVKNSILLKQKFDKTQSDSRKNLDELRNAIRIEFALDN